jgi:hypothetical protein
VHVDARQKLVSAHSLAEFVEVVRMIAAKQNVPPFSLSLLYTPFAPHYSVLHVTRSQTNASRTWPSR